MMLGYIPRAFFITSLFISISSVYADAELSPAEQAALAAQAQAQAISLVKQIALCNATVLNAPDEIKQELLTKLGDRTCEQAVMEDAAN